MASPVHVAFGEFTSLADGAMVKLARLGTVSPPPPELDGEDMGVPGPTGPEEVWVADSGIGDPF
jgi:hypothetical protein